MEFHHSKFKTDCFAPKARYFANLAPTYGCTTTDTQYLCTNSKLVQPLSTCVAANCSVIDALGLSSIEQTIRRLCSDVDHSATQRYQTKVCRAPMRDQGEPTRMTWCSLFAISVTVVALRFIARAPKFRGSGFGWDDWTMLFVLAFQVPHEVGLEISKSTTQVINQYNPNLASSVIQNGFGQDLWMLTPSHITTCLYASYRFLPTQTH
jgi:hypothetical protein